MSPNRVVDLSSLQQFTAVQLLSDPGHIGGPVVVPSCAEIVLNWTLEDGKPAHNVLFGRYSGAFAGTPAQATAIGTALTSGAAWTALASHLATTTSMAGVTIRDVNTPNQPIISPTGGTGVGTAPGEALPNEVAAVITFRTALAGRANRGRMFVPGFDVTATTVGNVMTPALVTALGNWALTIPSALSASGYTHVIGQRARAAYTGITGTSHPARPANSVPVSGWIVRDNHWDSQRKRGLK